MGVFDEINFLNAPNLTYKLIENEESKLGIIKRYIIRDVFGRLGIYIVINDGSSVTTDVIISILNKNDTLFNDFDPERQKEKPQLMDFIDTDQIYVEQESEISSFGEFLNTLYENNINAKKEPEWLLDRHFQFTSWFKENKFEKKFFNAKVVTGYSYKGGMGRSTLIALLASKAALEGKNVVVLDFDFEAPGISNLFYDFKSKKKSSGILDYIIEKPILKDKLRLEDYYLKIDNTATLPSTERKVFISGDIRIFPVCDISAGELNNYMQKIARVNFANLNKVDDNPLIDLIDEIDKKLSPDIIFIDSRTGISDIGGLSLKVLSDLNILIFANDIQNIDGMKAILPLFFSGKTETKDTIVVQSIIRIPPTPLYNSILSNEFESFKSNVQNIIKMQDEDYELRIVKMRYLDELLINIKYDTLIEILESRKDAPEFFINALYTDAVKSILPVKKNYEYKTKKVLLNKLIETKAGAEDTFKSSEDFRKRFLFKDEFSFIFKDDKFIIIGNKGEGKSALFSMLKNKTILDSYKKHLQNKYVLSKNQIKEDIESIFLEGFSAPEENKNFPNTRQFQSIYNKCDESLNKCEYFWECYTLYKLDEYNCSETPIFQSIDDVIEKFQDAVVLKEVYLKLKEWNSTTENKKIYFIYDYLDKHISELQDTRKLVISGLLSMWQKWYNLYGNIRSKIFLRNDIYKDISLTNKSHLDDYKLSLIWDYDELLKMILKYLISESDEVRNNIDFVIEKTDKDLGVFIINDPQKIYDALELVIDKSIHGGFASTKGWIKNHLSDSKGNMTPRTILWLISIGAFYEINNSKYLDQNDVIIHGYPLKYALKGEPGITGETISEKKVLELKEEYPELYEYVETLYQKLESKNLPVSETNLEKAFEDIANQKKLELKERYARTLTPQEVIKMLEEIGMINEYKQKGNIEVMYMIPDLYLFGLKLSRKGV